MGWILGFGIPVAYFLGVAVTFRYLYTRSMTEYLRWKNEDPDGVGYSFVERYSYDRITKKRKDMSYKWFRGSKKSHTLSPTNAWFWPGLGPYIAIKGFCFPDVKIPDVSKIKELEKL